MNTNLLDSLTLAGGAEVDTGYTLSVSCAIALRGILTCKLGAVPSFMINFDPFTPRPQRIQWIPMPELGTTIAGKPVRQGRPMLQVTWDVLTYDQMQRLYSYWNPAQPEVAIRAPHPRTGRFELLSARMHVPQIGGRMTMYYVNVTVQFSWVGIALPFPAQVPNSSYP